MSGSLKKNLVLVVFIVGFIFALGSIHSRTRNRVYDAILFAVITLIVFGMMFVFRYF
jgi:hypothetical protein